MTAKTMAEVIQEAVENTPYWIEGDPGTHQDPYANAAAALSAAGFGLVADAKAEALEEAAADHQLRLSGHSGISITRLRARAAALRGDS